MVEVFKHHRRTENTKKLELFLPTLDQETVKCLSAYHYVCMYMHKYNYLYSHVYREREREQMKQMLKIGQPR